MYYFKDEGKETVYYQIKGIMPDLVDWDCDKKTLIRVSTSDENSLGEGTLSLLAQSPKDDGKATVSASISSDTQTSFDVNVKPGNIRIYDGRSTPAIEYWSFLDNPEKLKANDKLRFVGKGDAGNGYWIESPTSGYYFYLFYSENQYDSSRYHKWSCQVFKITPELISGGPWDGKSFPVYLDWVNSRGVYGPGQSTQGEFSTVIYDATTDTWKNS